MRVGQLEQLLKTRMILILNFTRPHTITYKNCTPLGPITITKRLGLAVMDWVNNLNSEF